MGKNEKLEKGNDGLPVEIERLVIRPSGFKGKKTDKFLVKGSVYGQKYFCNSCGKTALGTNFTDDKHHHWKWCKWMKAEHGINQAAQYGPPGTTSPCRSG